MRRTVLLWIARIALFGIVGGMLLAYYGSTRDANAVIWGGIGTASVCAATALATFLLANLPDKALRNRWGYYIFTYTAARAEQEENAEPTSIDYAAELETVRANYAADPDPRKNRIEKPHASNVGACCDFSVLKAGKIYYACLVEADTKLFTPSRAVYGVSGAVVVYSPDPYFEQNPTALLPIAEAAYREPNALLQNDTRFFTNARISPNLTDGRAVYMSSVLVCRKQLPLGAFHKAGAIMPILAAPETCRSVFVVDSRYWTDALVVDFMTPKKSVDRYGEPFDV